MVLHLALSSAGVVPETWDIIGKDRNCPALAQLCPWICPYTVQLWSFLLLGSMFPRPSFNILKQSLNKKVCRTAKRLTLSKYVKEEG